MPQAQLFLTLFKKKGGGLLFSYFDIFICQLYIITNIKVTNMKEIQQGNLLGQMGILSRSAASLAALYLKCTTFLAHKKYKDHSDDHSFYLVSPNDKIFIILVFKHPPSVGSVTNMMRGMVNSQS